LSAIQNNLQRIRELAVQSANSGNSSSDRASLNLEAQQLISEIDRVATNSAFNGSKLLDGTYTNQDFQVGAGNETSDRIRISIGNAKASALGVVGTATGASTGASTGAVTSGALAAGDLAINGFAIAATSDDGVSFADKSASAISKANAINASTSLTGISAKADATSATFTVSSGATTSGAIAAGELKINGVDIGALSAVKSGASDADSVKIRSEQLVAAINAVSIQSGVEAKLDGTAVKLTAADGRNITVTRANTTNTELSGVSTATTYAALKLTSTKGDATIAVTGTSAGKEAVSFSASLALSTPSGQTVSSVDLSTQAKSQDALSILDAAIGTITNSRANLGAYQNRFEAAISNLETTSTNLQASRSRILDTDYAKETTNLAKAQIVQQAATAMLAQANQSSQSVLALLK
jgi:flagellin